MYLYFCSCYIGFFFVCCYFKIKYKDEEENKYGKNKCYWDGLNWFSVWIDIKYL